MKKYLHLVKRHGHFEKFDYSKIYKSCYKASLNAHLSKQKAAKIASYVVKKIKEFIKPKKAITSDQIFKQVVKHLKEQDKDVAFLYETHRDIS
ncbi:hypothetical protein HYX18_02995 [Candidatus Woesearchaeota archaeon]|nr:hypothetical protein [Candidatus Woesearchaeota archaeon]